MHTMEGSTPRLMQAANAAPLLDSLETAAPERQPAPTSLYQLTCARLDEQLAPLKVWPTLPDRTGRFSFTLLDRCGRILYRSPTLRQALYREEELLNGVIATAVDIVQNRNAGYDHSNLVTQEELLLCSYRGQ